MKIEKLDCPITFHNYSNQIACSNDISNIRKDIGTIAHKINELIDAFNKISEEDIPLLASNLLAVGDKVFGKKEEKEPEILPLSCPFCGFSPEILEESAEFYIDCINEKCVAFNSNISFDTKQEAISAWNKREK